LIPGISKEIMSFDELCMKLSDYYFEQEKWEIDKDGIR